VDVSEVLEFPHCLERNLVQCTLIAAVQDASVPQHATAKMKGQLLEDVDVETEAREVRQPLSGAEGSPRTILLKDEADVDVRSSVGVTTSLAAEQKNGENIAIALH